MTPENFIVIIHDVTPCHGVKIKAILNVLKPLITKNLAVAVVPKWHGSNWSYSDREFTDIIKHASGEILLHGFTHYRPKCDNILSALTMQSDEFTDLNAKEVISRLQMGQQFIKDRFDSEASGFVPPAWIKGKIRSDMLSYSDIDYYMDMLSVNCNDGKRISLATWSWDWGVLNCLGYIGELTGHFLYTLRQSVPCIVFHPKDAESGYVQFGVKRIRHFLNKGFVPVLPKDTISPVVNR